MPLDAYVSRHGNDADCLDCELEERRDVPRTLTPFKATSGLVVTAFEPRSPAIFPDPDTVMKASIDTKSDILFCVPSFVEVSNARSFGSSILRIYFPRPGLERRNTSTT